MKLNKEIFREYDIRGIWEKDILCVINENMPIKIIADGQNFKKSGFNINIEEVEKEGLFSTIEKGIFGGVKRPFDGGHGLEGVCTKGENYFNPFIPLFMDHE